MGVTTVARLTLLLCFLTLVGACRPHVPESQSTSGDCVAPIAFSSQTYSMLMGHEVTEVAPGDLLGTGQFAPCDDGAGLSADSREVYSLPSVPPEQAIVLLGSGDLGTVLLSTESPVAGWDADLLTLLDAWSVQRPTH